MISSVSDLDEIDPVSKLPTLCDLADLVAHHERDCFQNLRGFVRAAENRRPFEYLNSCIT